MIILKDPDLRIGRKVDEWILSSDMVIECLETGPVVIPIGFVTDLASIPWFFRRVIPRGGKHRLAAIPHDYLYSVNYQIPDGKKLNREIVDGVFFNIMKECGVPNWKRSVMFRVVRIFGGLHQKLTRN